MRYNRKLAAVSPEEFAELNALRRRGRIGPFFYGFSLPVLSSWTDGGRMKGEGIPWLAVALFFAGTVSLIGFGLRMFGASSDQAIVGGVLLTPVVWWLAVQKS